MSQLAESMAAEARHRATRRKHRMEPRRSRREEFLGQRRREEMGAGERSAFVAAGTILAALGISRRSVPGAIVAGVGGGLIYQGLAGRDVLWLGALPAGVEGREPENISEYGIHVQRALLINKSAEELYRFWRDFENLPRVLEHLQSVQVFDNRRSHWAARAPRIVGGTVEWDAEITRDEPNARIGWRSLPGGDVETVGEIRFSKARGDRGTEVRAYMDYLPPAGRLGYWLATLFGESPQQMFEKDLRRFKAVMECGEFPTIVGQPRGRCISILSQRRQRD